MIDTLLALVPDYGVSLVFVVVVLACLAIPMPASVLVLTAGSFAATGDLSLPLVFVTAFGAYVLGDQLAYGIARRVGPRVVTIFERSDRTGPMIEKSRDLLQRRGATAVFLSHTLFSPTCPYVSYLAGAGGLQWRRFTLAAVTGAVVWTAGYVGLGYVFATQLSQVAEALSNFFGIILAVFVVIMVLLTLRRRWAAHRHGHKPTAP